MRNTFFTAAALAGLLLLAQAATAEDAPKEIRFATEGSFTPWNKTNPDGSVGGFEIDLMKNLCGRMGVSCTFAAQSFDAMIPALNDGKYDALIDAIGITPAREQVIAFSKPYASLCYSFATIDASSVTKTLPADDKTVVIKDESDPILDQLRTGLKDKVIGSMASGTSTKFIDTYLKQAATVKSYKTPDSRNLDLLAGRVDVIFASKDSLVAIKKKPQYSSLTLAGPCLQGGVLGSGAVGVGLRKTGTQLKSMFDKAIAEAQADGTIKKMSDEVFGMDMSAAQ